MVENDRQKTVKVSEMDEIALPGLDAEEVSRDKQIQVTPVKKGYRITATESGVLRIPLDPDMKTEHCISDSGRKSYSGSGGHFSKWKAK